MEPQRGIIIWRNSFPPAPAAARTRSTTLNASKIDSFSCLNSLKCVKHALNRFTISRVLVWTKIIFGDSIIMWFGWWYRLVWSQPKLNSKKTQCNNHYLWILKMGWLSKSISLRSIPIPQDKWLWNFDNHPIFKIAILRKKFFLVQSAAQKWSFWQEMSNFHFSLENDPKGDHWIIIVIKYLYNAFHFCWFLACCKA